MIKNTLLTICCWLVFGPTMAQDNNDFEPDWSTDVYIYGEMYPGYVVDTFGNKIEGYIRFQDRYTMQNTVNFFRAYNNYLTERVFDPSELSEYKVADKLYHCIHYSGGFFKKPVRANLVVQEGCINSYVWYDRADDYLVMQPELNETEDDFYQRMYPPKTVFVKEGTKDVKSLAKFLLGFSKKMSEFVSDDLDLAKKILAKEKGYSAFQIFRIIEEYNQSCSH